MIFLPVRGICCFSHFGNGYEAAWPREMEYLLSEMREWGYNYYSDEFSTFEGVNPYQKGAHTLAKELVRRKKVNFLAAQKQGFGLNLLVVANSIYCDQFQTEFAITKGPKINVLSPNSVACPSHPKARKVILNNYRR